MHDRLCVCFINDRTVKFNFNSNEKLKMESISCPLFTPFYAEKWNEKICCEWKNKRNPFNTKIYDSSFHLLCCCRCFVIKHTHTHISIPLLAFIMQLNSCRKAGSIEHIFPCRYYINVGEKEKSIILTQYTRLNEFVCTCAHVCVGV